MAMKAWNLSFIFGVRTWCKRFQVFDFKDSDLGDLLSSRPIMEFQLHYRKHGRTFIHPFQLYGASISEWSPWGDELRGRDVVRGSAAMHSSWIKVYVEDKRTSVLRQVPNSYPAVSFPIHLVLLARDFSFCSSGPLLLRQQCKFSKGWEQVGAEQQCAKPEAAQVPPPSPPSPPPWPNDLTAGPAMSRKKPVSKF